MKAKKPSSFQYTTKKIIGGMLPYKKGTRTKINPELLKKAIRKLNSKSNREKYHAIVLLMTAGNKRIIPELMKLAKTDKQIKIRKRQLTQ